jgi:hypothetical protein
MNENIKFIRLATGEEIVAEITENADSVHLKYPLIVEVETFMEEGRQLLYMKEYLPQSVVGVKEVDISKEIVIISVPVAAEFVEQFEQATEFFYNSEVKKPSKKKAKVEEASKVVSLFEAMIEKKDKPVH